MMIFLSSRDWPGRKGPGPAIGPVMDFPRKLRIMLADRDLTIKEVAVRLDVRPNTVARWTKGQRMPSLQDGLRLADALGVDVRWLVDDARDYPPPSVAT